MQIGNLFLVNALREKKTTDHVEISKNPERETVKALIAIRMGNFIPVGRSTE